MSIFPKHVTKNENVIVHLRFTNNSNKTSLFCYHTRIISPRGHLTKEWKGKFIMPPKSDNDINVKDLYQEVSAELLNESGKYMAKTDLFINGKIFNSITEKTDYFFVDDISFSSYMLNDGKTCYELINTSSNSSVKCTLINSDGTKCIEAEIEPNQLFRCKDESGLQLRYENNTIQQSIVAMRYMKNQLFDYRVNNDELELFNDNTLECYSIPNALGYVWLNCNGLVTIDDLTCILQLDKKIVAEMIDYLVECFFILEVKI